MMDRASGVPTPPSQAFGDHAVDTNPKTLLALFSIWKLFLLTIAALSPGPGYDTSTQILFGQYAHTATSQSWLADAVQHLVARLTRWDAIYFTSDSQRGLVYEQEWAFSPAYATATSIIARVLPSISTSPIVNQAIAAILLSHTAHYLAVLALYRLTYELILSNNDTKRRIAFIASCLHILSPGGLFLSAPYAESTFAALNFWGMYCYVLARKTKHDDIGDAISVALSMLAVGASFGAASAIRGNGILSGLVLLWDALICLPKVPAAIQQRQWSLFIQLAGLVSGGLILACIYAITQTSAYLEYCTNGNTRPWCDRLYPSIYTWVQEHYWGVGFLKYWTLSNLPLFLLAAPMLLILLLTGYLALARTELVACLRNALDGGKKSDQPATTASEISIFTHTMARFALPQFILALLAMTNFHVQIVNRISSGYPVWYIMLAIALHAGMRSSPNSTPLVNWLSRRSQWIVRGAFMYAIIQGGLYASFMPPA